MSCPSNSFSECRTSFTRDLSSLWDGSVWIYQLSTVVPMSRGRTCIFSRAILGLQETEQQAQETFNRLSFSEALFKSIFHVKSCMIKFSFDWQIKTYYYLITLLLLLNILNFYLFENFTDCNEDIKTNVHAFFVKNAQSRQISYILKSAKPGSQFRLGPKSREISFPGLDKHIPCKTSRLWTSLPSDAYLSSPNVMSFKSRFSPLWLS